MDDLISFLYCIFCFAAMGFCAVAFGFCGVGACVLVKGIVWDAPSVMSFVSLGTLVFTGFWSGWGLVKIYPHAMKAAADF